MELLLNFILLWSVSSILKVFASFSRTHTADAMKIKTTYNMTDCKHSSPIVTVLKRTVLTCVNTRIYYYSSTMDYYLPMLPILLKHTDLLSKYLVESFVLRFLRLQDRLHHICHHVQSLFNGTTAKWIVIYTDAMLLFWGCWVFVLQAKISFLCLSFFARP